MHTEFFHFYITETTSIICKLHVLQSLSKTSLIVYAGLTYVNPILHNLFLLPYLCSVYRFLGKLYAAESLVLLDRIAEAVELLSYEVTDLSMRISESADKTDIDDSGNDSMDTLGAVGGSVTNVFPSYFLLVFLRPCLLCVC